MDSKDIIGVIELGNINIKCVIFKLEKNKLEIAAASTAPSEGIQNDTIINLKKSSDTIRSCISEAEKKAKISLKKISIIFEQPDFLSTNFSKQKKIDGSKIHKDDIDFLLKEAKKQLILNDKKHSIIHIFNHNYIVDGKIFIEEPIDVYADLLTHEITFITIPTNNLKNINQVFINCDIEIERLISRTFSLGVKLLNDNELEVGASIIDFGHEKVSFGLFKNFALVHSITFPIGVNHIIKDISKVCSLDLEESKNIVKDFDFSFNTNPKLFDENNYLKNTFFIHSNYRKISKSLISNVIKSRIDEIIDILKKQLIVPRFHSISTISVILTGGGSNLNNIEKYLIETFLPNVKKVFSEDNNLSSCLGALKIIKNGWETEAIPEISDKSNGKMGFFSKIFKAY